MGRAGSACAAPKVTGSPQTCTCRAWPPGSSCFRSVLPPPPVFSFPSDSESPRENLPPHPGSPAVSSRTRALSFIDILTVKCVYGFFSLAGDVRSVLGFILLDVSQLLPVALTLPVKPAASPSIGATARTGAVRRLGGRQTGGPSQGRHFWGASRTAGQDRLPPASCSRTVSLERFGLRMRTEDPEELLFVWGTCSYLPCRTRDR